MMTETDVHMPDKPGGRHARLDVSEHLVDQVEDEWSRDDDDFDDDAFLADEPTRPRSWLRWLMLFVFVVIALTAIIARVSGVDRPARHPAASGSARLTAEQVGDAGKDLCAAVRIARQAVVRGTHMENPVPGDPIGKLAVAANAKLALSESSAYLRHRLEVDTAAPENLAKSVGRLANTIEDLSMSYLTGERDEARERLRSTLDSQLGALCS